MGTRVCHINPHELTGKYGSLKEQQKVVGVTLMTAVGACLHVYGKPHIFLYACVQAHCSPLHTVEFKNLSVKSYPLHLFFYKLDMY